MRLQELQGERQTVFAVLALQDDIVHIRFTPPFQKERSSAHELNSISLPDLEIVMDITHTQYKGAG